MKRRRVGLALGGGGARGLAHIGVLQCLEEAGVPIDCVTGTSVGSLIGALLVCGYDGKELERRARDVDWSDLVGVTWPKRGLVQAEKLERVLSELTDGKSFSDLDTPFAAVAADITTGTAVLFSQGSIAAAVRASCSVPVVFEPVEIDGRLLVDGALVNEVPGDIARDLGAEVVIGVDLNVDRTKNKRPDHLVDVLFCSFNILIAGMSQKGKAAADVAIEPDLEGFRYADLSRIDEAIERGYAATHEKVRDIVALVGV